MESHQRLFFEQGNDTIMGSKDAAREAFQRGLVAVGQGWMEMVRSRNLSSHTYNEQIALEISNKVSDSYLSLFEAFSEKMKTLKTKS